MAGRAIADAICKNRILRHLDLEGNELGPDAGAALAGALKRNNTLRVLNVKNNRFEHVTGGAFLDAYAANSSNAALCSSERGSQSG